MSKVNVRYIVNDVDAAIPFYTDMLGFKVEMHPAPGFASLSRGDLQLLLNRPGAGVSSGTIVEIYGSHKHSRRGHSRRGRRWPKAATATAKRRR